ncbi:EamA family transporter [Alicyclobacillus ferrooxydans]|uniref:EamA domain-containing protein n=1 Tax=Alicyclobacillus ferrooxydans TaxID=471514 RepID=A0A0P9C9M0_9BACL|nr:EamA family transporter [Alicyclobacillus ferrooxydans]KPV41839.1 hypothetical protein AN477_20225 [Alicyclobacillus ferrooxydans]
MQGVVTATIAALCYALSYIFIRKGQVDSNPGDHGLFPVLVVSGATLTTALFIKVQRNPSPLVMGAHTGLAILFCVLAGVLGTCFGRMTLYAAIARIGATRGVIIDMLSAMVTLSIAVSFLGEKFRLTSIYGMALIVLGLVLVVIERVWFPLRSLKHIYRSGVLMSFAAAMLQGVGHVFRKPSAGTAISPTFAATLDILSALALYTLLLLFTGRFKRYVSHYIRHINLYFLTAGFLSAAGVLLFFQASSAIPISQVSMIISIQPVIVAVLSGFLLARLEEVTWVTIVSSILVTLGVVTISF